MNFMSLRPTAPFDVDNYVGIELQYERLEHGVAPQVHFDSNCSLELGMFGHMNEDL